MLSTLHNWEKARKLCNATGLVWSWDVPRDGYGTFSVISVLMEFEAGLPPRFLLLPTATHRGSGGFISRVHLLSPDP